MKSPLAARHKKKKKVKKRDLDSKIAQANSNVTAAQNTSPGQAGVSPTPVGYRPRRGSKSNIMAGPPRPNEVVEVPLTEADTNPTPVRRYAFSRRFLFSFSMHQLTHAAHTTPPPSAQSGTKSDPNRCRSKHQLWWTIRTGAQGLVAGEFLQPDTKDSQR